MTDQARKEAEAIIEGSFYKNYEETKEVVNRIATALTKRDERIAEAEKEIKRVTELFAVRCEKIAALEKELEKTQVLPVIKVSCSTCKKLVEEKAALVEELEHLKHSTHCSFCDFEVPLDVDSEVIAKHIKECPKHPMRDLEQENGRLRSVLGNLVQLCRESFFTLFKDLKQFKDAEAALTPALNKPLVSDCCGSTYHVSTADEGTSCHVCDKCGKPCDAALREKEPSNEI